MHITQKQIIKFSLVTFIIVFSFLIYLDSINELPITSIENISVKNINEYVRIQGKIGKQDIIKNISFINIYDKTGMIPSIMFDLNKTINSKKEYNFIGKITMYKNEPEIVLYEINEI